MSHKQHPAQRKARRIAIANGYPLANVQRRIDTSFPQRFPCWIIAEASKWAVVVYEDEPKCVVSTGNYEGRYEVVALEGESVS